MDVQRLRTPALAMSYALVPWDTATFGFAVAHVADLAVADAAAAGADFAAFEDWRDAQGVRLVSHRCERSRAREWMFLEDRGFRFVEMVYRPVFEAVQGLAYPDHGLAVAPAGAADVPALEEIARVAFATGRFALDPRLDPQLNGRRYAAWVRNSMAHPTQRLLRISEGNEPVAFFIVEDVGAGRCHWHLTGVAPAHHGRGVGRRVWQAMLMRHKAEGVAAVQTVVSAHNLPVLNLYATLGFRLRKADVTLHWVRER